MQVTVMGASGRAGSRIVAALGAAGHEVVPVSPATGVDLLTGAGLDTALAGARALVDASNGPPDDAESFFRRAAGNLIEAARRNGVSHFVLLSIVGADRMIESPYMRAKIVQERLVAESGIGYTIVRSTQFQEFVPSFADIFADGDAIRVPDARMQPIALDDAGGLIAKIAVGQPVNGTVEIGGPDAVAIAEAIAITQSSSPGARRIIVDAHARYFGAALDEATLLPGRGAQLGATAFQSPRITK